MKYSGLFYFSMLMNSGISFYFTFKRYINNTLSISAITEYSIIYGELETEPWIVRAHAAFP